MGWCKWNCIEGWVYLGDRIWWRCPTCNKLNGEKRLIADATRVSPEQV